MAIESILRILERVSTNFWDSFAAIIPGLIAAIIVIFIGWLLGSIGSGIVSKVISRAKVDRWLEKNNLSQALYGRKLSSVLGTLLKWYIIVIFLGEAANLVQLASLSAIISSIVLFLPALIGAGLVVIGGLLVSEYLKKTALATKFAYRELVGDAIKFLVIYFALVTGLQTAGFEVSILLDAFRIGFAAVVITAAIVIGISFGLALKDDAKKILRSIQIGKRRRRR